MRAITLIALAFCVSCAAPSLSVNGRFSDRDIREITYLVEHRQGFKKPIRTITREIGDRAIVQTGRCSGTGDYCVTIPLAKRQGKWHIEEARVEEEYIVVSTT